MILGGSLTSLVPVLDRVERGFAISNALKWMDEHWVWSVYLSLLYMTLVYVGRQWMKHRVGHSLRKPLILWNIGLAIFSVCGMSAVLPNVLSHIYQDGLLYTACHSDCISDEYKHLSLWGWIFALSKVIEFGDTLFIVLRKSPLPFLHWYHHVTVCIYSWYSLTNNPTAVVTWFGGMNYTVHTFMYSYFAVRATGYKPHPFIAKTITVMQLSQMFLAIFAQLVSWQTAKTTSDCMFRYDLFYSGAAMYFTYAMLFANFFYQRYIRKS